MPQPRANSISLLLAVAVGLAWLAIPGAVSAEEKRVALDYQRTESASDCPGEQAIREGVAARLGYDPFDSASDRKMAVQIRARSFETGYAARIEVRAPGSKQPRVRELDTPDPGCGELSQALVFAVSVAIDPTSAVGPSGSGPDPAEHRQGLDAAMLRVHDASSAAKDALPAPPPEPEPTMPPPPSSTRKSGGEFHGAVGAGLALGSTPRPSALVRLGAGLSWSRFSFRMAGRIDTPSTLESGGGNLETTLVLGEVAPCGLLEWAFGCGVVTGGVIHLAGFDYRDNQSQTLPYVAAGLRLGGDIGATEWLRIRLQGDVLATMTQTHALVGDETVWRTPPVSATISLAGVFEFL